MDIRTNLDRLEPAQLRPLGLEQKKAVNELKERLFFFLQVSDGDFPSGEGSIAPQSTEGAKLRLKLSKEHSGFTFIQEPRRAADMLHHHSGGKCSDALLMAMSADKDQMVATLGEVERDADDDGQITSTSTVSAADPSAAAVSFHTGESPGTYMEPIEMDLVFPKPKKNVGLLCCFGVPGDGQGDSVE